jgi:peptidoglycan/LPS O-acetylase OafA/YrhL
MGTRQEEQTHPRGPQQPTLAKSTPRGKAGFQFKHLPQLDGLRGVAVIMVLIDHQLFYGPFSLPWRRAGEALGSLGVFLFFVLSGFLITSLLYIEKRDTGTVSLSNFYIRRALRLGPALLLFLSIIVILMACHAITDVPRYEIFASLFYARNFFGHSTSLAHLWSLSLEEQFYLCWPLVFTLIPIKRSLPVTVGITASFAVWRGLAIHFALFDYSRGIYYERPYFRFDSILIGACVAIAVVTYPEFVSRARIVGRRLPTLLIWPLLFWWTLYGEEFSKPLFITIQTLLLAYVVLQLALAERGPSLKFFTQPALCYVGKISYSLYLWQQIFTATRTPSWGVLRIFPINFLASFALAILSYHLIERPALRLKKKFQFAET